MADIQINPTAAKWNHTDAGIEKRQTYGGKIGAGAVRAIGFSAIGMPETDDDEADMTQGACPPFADIHILDLRPNRAILPPEDAIFAPPIRTITLNILAGDPAPGAPDRGDAPVAFRLAFTTLHPLPSHIIAPPARLRIRLTAASRQKLLASTLGRTATCEHIEIPGLLGCIGGIYLRPGETLPILLEYDTDYLDDGSALRVLQYAGEPDAERLTGVQIYVFTGIGQ